MRLRVVCLALLLALAGCSGPPVEGGGGTETVTPVPVPGAGVGDDGDGSTHVDADERGRAHERTLSMPHTRTHALTVSRNGAVLLEYRETATVGAGTESRLRRNYSGPLTPRFIPYVSDASTASDERYVGEGEVSRRQVIDGDRRGTATNALVAPLLVTDDGALVAALLDGSRVVERTRESGARLRNDRVHPRAVPQFLDEPRNGQVTAMVREDGRITRLVVSYEATLDGKSVLVEQTFRWERPAEPVTPEWVDGQADE